MRILASWQSLPQPYLRRADRPSILFRVGAATVVGPLDHDDPLRKYTEASPTEGVDVMKLGWRLRVFWIESPMLVSIPNGAGSRVKFSFPSNAFPNP